MVQDHYLTNMSKDHYGFPRKGVQGGDYRSARANSKAKNVTTSSKSKALSKKIKGETPHNHKMRSEGKHTFNTMTRRWVKNENAPKKLD